MITTKMKMICREKSASRVLRSHCLSIHLNCGDERMLPFVNVWIFVSVISNLDLNTVYSQTSITNRTDGRLNGTFEAINATTRLGQKIPCSANCTCFDNVADCSNRKLHEIPADLTPNIVTLNLSGNHIAELPSSLFFALVNLTILDISNNSVSSIKKETFEYNKKLQVLNITDNPIEEFSVESLKLPEFKSLKTNLFGLCCVFSFVPDCQGPVEFGFSTCNSFLNNSGLTALLWVVLLAIIFSNSLLMVLRFKKYTTENSTALLALAVQLSISYVIGALSLLIVASASAHLSKGDFLLNNYDDWVEGAGCSLAGVFNTASSQASLMLMFLISCERFSSVVISPNADAKWRTGIYIACPVIWLISFALASVPLVADNYFEELYYSWSSLCIPLYTQTPVSSSGWQYSLGIFFVFDVLVLIGTLVLYVLVLVNSSNYTMEQEDDIMSRKFEFDKLKSLLPAAVMDGCLWLPLIGLSVLGPTGTLVSISSLAWISTVVHQLRGVFIPLALICWTRMQKPILSQRASTRRARAIKKIRCLSIPNVEAGLVHIAQQAMIQNGVKSFRGHTPTSLAQSLIKQLSEDPTKQNNLKQVSFKRRSTRHRSFRNGTVKFADGKPTNLAEHLEQNLKLTMTDIQNLLLDISIAVSELEAAGTDEIIIKEDTILVNLPEFPEERIHFSIILPKKENGSVGGGDGEAVKATGGDEAVDCDENLADLISRLLKRFKPLKGT